MHGTLAVIERPEEIPAPVANYVEKNPGQLLLDEGLRKRFFAEIEAEIEAAPVDLATEKGRKAIASLAYKVATTKKPIDDAGKKLKEEAQARVNAVDTLRRECAKTLNILQAKARAPLDEWESEKSVWAEYATIAYGWTSDLVLGRLESAKETPCHPTLTDDKEKAIAALAAAYQRLLQEEEDAAELARLREKEADEARRKAEAGPQEAELAAALDAKARSPQQATDFAGVRQGVQEAQGLEPTPNPTQSAPTKIISRADAAFIAKLTEIREDIMRAAADGGFAISVQSARAIVRAIVAGKVRHIPALQL